MTNPQKKRAQAELELLLHRKAKADALGPEVIASQQQLYDNICSRVVKIKDDLAIATGGAVADLLAVLRTQIDHGWDSGGLSDVLSSSTTARDQLQAAEDEMIAAYNQGQGTRYKEALKRYEATMTAVREKAAARKAQTTLFDDWEDINDENNPFIH